jgi:hypothetical protein
MRGWAVAFLSALAVSALSAPAYSAACRWDGTGPICEGKCNENEVQVRRWDGGGNIYSPFDAEGEPHFGAGCPSGEKALCCPKCGPGLVAVGTYLDQRCVTPEEKAADEARQVSPGPQFCEYYATKAVEQVSAASKCGFPTVGRWDPNKQNHLNWCLAQKGQSSSWSEFNTRAELLKDCLAKLPPPPPSGTGPISLGPPVVTVPQDVDIYAEPGGVGRPFGMVKAGTKAQESDERPDHWCRIFGDAVPNGSGWVWCGADFELKKQ